MSDPYCAVCGTHLSVETDHISLAAQQISPTGRGAQDDYYLHVECWDRLSEGWLEP